MKMSDMFNAAALEMVRDLYDASATEVRYINDRQEAGGGCETCSYTDYYVYIGFKNQTGQWREFAYRGRFDDLIRTLDSYDVEVS